MPLSKAIKTEMRWVAIDFAKVDDLNKTAVDASRQFEAGKISAEELASAASAAWRKMDEMEAKLREKGIIL